MPNRILREGILTSERIEQLAWDEEVFYRRLMSVVDDFGRYYARPALLLAACYPLILHKVTHSDIERWLAACVRAKLVRVYTASDDKAYLLLEDFRQQVRSTKSKFKAPDETTEAGTTHLRSTCVAETSQAPIEQQASAHLDVSVSVSEDVSEGGDEDVIHPPGADAPSPPLVGDSPADHAEPDPPPRPADAPPEPKAPRRRSPAAAASQFVRPDDIPEQVWNEFLAYRLEMAKGHGKAPFTVAAMKGVIKDIRKCGETGEKPEDALYRCMARGWRTPYPERDMPARNAPDTPRRLTQSQMNSMHGARFGSAAIREFQPPEGNKNATDRQDIEDVEYRDANRGRGPEDF